MVNRTKNAFWGVTADIFWQGILTLSTFIVVPIILQFIPKEIYGFWLVTLSILGYLGIFDLSIGMALTHFVARVAYTEKRETISDLVSTAFFSFLCVGVTILFIGWGLSAYVSTWFNVPEAFSSNVVLSFRIVVFATAIALPLSTFSGMISGSQHMAVSITIRRSTFLAGTILSVFLLYKGFGLVGLALSRLFAILIGGIMSYLFCKHKYFKEIKISFFSSKKSFLRSIWGYGGFFQLGRIANTVSLSTDAILIALILGTALVPTYTFTSKLAILVSVSLVSKLPAALFPALSQMYQRGEIAKVRSIFVKLAAFSSRIAVVFSVFLFLCNKEFVTLWVGSDYFGGNILNVIFVSWIFLDSLYRGTCVVVQASGDLKQWSMVSALEAFVNIVISFILVQKIGLIGIALGTTIARTVSGCYTMFLACQKSKLSPEIFIFRGLALPMIRSIPSCCVLVITFFLLSPPLSWVELCFIGLLGGATNVLLFEGVELMKYSERSFKERVRKLFVLKPV